MTLPTISRRSFLAAGAALSASLAFTSGCAKKEGGAKSSTQDDKPLQCFLNNPKSLDPKYAPETWGVLVIMQLFDPLMRFDHKAKKLVPLACESFEVSDDATEFTFHLRKGAKFHNGEEVTSQHFKTAWERVCNPNGVRGESVLTYHLADIEGQDAMVKGEATQMSGLSCPDDYTFKVKLSTPYADFPYICTHPVTSPVPLNTFDNEDAFNLTPVGNGAFKMKGKWEDGQYIQVERFEDYYGEKASINGVDFKIFKENEAAFREFEAGNLDCTQIPGSQAPRVRQTYGEAEDGSTSTPGHQAIVGPKSRFAYYGLNNKDPFLSDPRVRRAINLAVNRDAICETVFQGLATPADCVVPPSINGYVAGSYEYARYDVEAAKKLMAEAGYEGKTVELNLIIDEGNDQKQAAQMLKSDLEKIGINLTIDVMEWANLLSRMTGGNYQMIRSGWTADYPIMDNFLFPLFKSGNGDNIVQYSNPAYDEALLKARQITNEDERIKAMQACLPILSEDCPVLALMFPKLDWVTSKRFTGIYSEPGANVYFANCKLSE